MKEPIVPPSRLQAARERLTPNSRPLDLTDVVCRELESRGFLSPEPRVLTTLFETLYFTSLRTEEGSTLTCHVIWLDPTDPDLSRPERLSGDRWTFIALAEPIALTVRSLAKLSRASDPRTSSFVVYAGPDGILRIYGFVDQGNQFYEFVNDRGSQPPDRPGLFQASIEGAGHLVVHLGYEVIAELRMNELAEAPVDVLTSGSVFRKLRPSIVRHIVEVLNCVGPEAFEAGDDWPAVLANTWIASFCRLLLRCQNYRHGGALLITPEQVTPHLNPRYRLTYDRLPKSLIRRGNYEIRRSIAHRSIHSDYIGSDGRVPPADTSSTPHVGDQTRTAIPAELYLDATLNEAYVQESSNSIDGAIWFISLLTRVDGLVVLDPSLRVTAFGTEITLSHDPGEVYLAGDAEGTPEFLRPLDDRHFGTRHLSMIRYCAASPESVGFVISQDGDVRAITRVDDRVLVWDNVALRLDEFRTTAGG